MAAEFVDALKGYEHFLNVRGKASMDEINEHLISHGRRPISLRTYGHYRKLLANGFRSYLPINRFDVFQSLGRLQMAADRRRYHREIVNLFVQLSRNREKWVDGLIIDKSLVGFGVKTSKRFPITPGRQIWIRLDGYYDIPAILVWRKHQVDSTRMGIRAIEFIAKYQVSDERIDIQRLKGLLQITREMEGRLEWDDFYRVFDKTDELLDAVSDLIYSIDEFLNSDIRLARSVLSSMKFGSSGDAQIKIDLGIAEILKLVVEKLQFWGVEKRKYKAETRKIELEVANLEIETIRNAIHLKHDYPELGVTEAVISELPETVKRVFNVTQLPPGLFDNGSPERSILSERVIPATTELVAGDDPDFDIEVTID